jgi:hypothetical protein
VAGLRAHRRLTVCVTSATELAFNRSKEASMYRKPIGPTAHGVIDYAFATLKTLRASV